MYAAMRTTFTTVGVRENRPHRRCSQNLSRDLAILALLLPGWMVSDPLALPTAVPTTRHPSNHTCGGTRAVAPRVGTGGSPVQWLPVVQFASAACTCRPQPAGRAGRAGVRIRLRSWTSPGPRDHPTPAGVETPFRLRPLPGVDDLASTVLSRGSTCWLDSSLE